MRHWLVLAGILAAVPALAGDDELSFTMGLRPTEESCPPEKAVEVALEAVMANPRAYDNTCVVVRGYVSSHALFTDPDDMMVRYANSTSQLKARRIGISASENLQAKLSGRYSRDYVELRGKVWMCEDYRPWGGGYCHYTDGPFIGVVAARTAREPMRYRREWE